MDDYLRENHYRLSDNEKHCKDCFYFFPIHRNRPGCFRATVEIDPEYICDRFRSNDEVNQELSLSPP